MAVTNRAKVTKWNVGDAGTAAQAVTFELNIEKTGNEEGYQVFCVNNLDESLNYENETVWDFCSDVFSSTSTTGIDMEWSSEMVLRYGTSSTALAAKRFDLQAMNNIPMRITNTLTGEKIEAQVSITDWSTTMTANELMKAEFTVKPFFGGVTRTVLPVVEP